MKIVGSYSTIKLGYASGRAQVHSVKLSKGVATIHAIAVGQPDDSDLWGTQSATIKINWSKKKRKLVGSKPAYYNEWRTFKALASAIRAKNRKAALRYATPSTVDELLGLQRWGGKLTTYSCHGMNWTMTESLPWDLIDIGTRGCVVGRAYPDGADGGGFMVRFEHSNAAWTSFEATDVQQFAG
ncbi:hypothetical protein AAEX63_02020 [Luteococcus sp. H138]